MTKSIVEVVPGTIYAVGWSVPADRRVSWVPPEPGRELALSAYVLRCGADALIIDTSVRAHGDHIQEGWSELVSDCENVDAVMTRYNFDTLGNLHRLARGFRVSRLYTARSISFVTAHIESFMEAFEDANINSHIAHESGLTPTPIRPGTVLEIADLRIEILRPALRMQSTLWLYESTTRTLFCSDGWGFLTQSRQGPPDIVSASDPRISLDRMARYFALKFDWMPGANNELLEQSFRGFLENHRIERVCPSMGAIIEGIDDSSQFFDTTFEALALLRETDYANQVIGTDQYPVGSAGY